MSTKNEDKGFFTLMKKLDYFATTFQFRINNYKKFGSATGGIIFCIYLFISISYFLIRFKDYVSWEDKRLLFIDKSPEKSPVLNLKNLSLEYAISITYDDETSIFESIYKDLFIIEHRYIIVNNTSSNSELIKTLAETRYCNNTDFNKIDANNNIHKNKHLYKCFNLENHFNLEGIYTDNIFSYVEIYLRINNSYFSNYTYLEQIFKENQFKYTIYYTDHFIDVGQSNQTNRTKHIEAIYTYINLQYYERVNIFLQEVEFCSDVNLFYTQFKCNKFQKFFKYENKMGPLPNRMYLPEDKRDPISKFILRAESTTRQIMVSYIKISEFLSNVLALLVNALVILNMIIIPMNELKARQTINEKVMKVKDVIKIENKHLLEYFTENFRRNKNYNPSSIYKQDSEKLLTYDKFSLDNINNEIPKYPNKKNSLEKTSVDSKNKTPKTKEMPNLNEISIISNTPKLHIKNNHTVFSEISKTDLTCSDRIKFLYHNNLSDITSKDMSKIHHSSFIKNENKIITRENIYKNKLDTSYFGKINNNEELKQKDNQSLDKEVDWIKDVKKTIILNRKNPFKIRIRDVINYIFRCKNIEKKLEINNLADIKFNKTIDIVNFITKMHEIDILKYLILDEDMVEIMDFLSKPHVASDELSKKNESFEKFFNNEIEKSSAVDNMINIKNLFDKLMKRGKPDIFGLKLMKLFDHEIKNLKT